MQDAEDIVKDATDPNELAEAAAAAQAPAGTSPPAAAVLPIPASAVANNPDGAIHLAKLLAFSKSKKDRRKGIAIFHQVFASGELQWCGDAADVIPSCQAVSSHPLPRCY